MDWFLDFSACVAGLVLLVAAATKFGSPEALARVIQRYDLVPDRWAALAARALPSTELLLGGLLLTGWAMAYAGIAAGALFLTFAVAIAINLLRGRADIPCGCFGPSEHASLEWSYVVRNVLLAGCAASGAIARGSSATAPLMQSRIDHLSALLAGAAALACWWLATTSTQLLRRASFDGVWSTSTKSKAGVED